MSDLIDRQAAIDVAWQEIDCGTYFGIPRRIEALPSVQPEKRTEERTETHACDTISRQEAIDTLGKIPVREFKKTDDGLLDALISIGQVYRALKQLPSAQPEPCEDAVSRKLMYELGATCMARRDENGELVALGRLDMLPSAHPEVIRCKDCVHWDTSWQNDYAPNYHYCPMVDGTRKDDFYCADAERRTDG